MNNNDNQADYESDALNALGRENPFAVPEGYFGTLPGLISERIGAAPSVGRIVAMKPKHAFLYAAAACAAVVFLVAGIYLSRPVGRTVENTTGVSYDDLYSSGYLFDLDEHLLVEELAYNTVEAGSASVSDPGIENYLIDNSADISGYYLDNL